MKTTVTLLILLTVVSLNTFAQDSPTVAPTRWCHSAPR